MFSKSLVVPTMLITYVLITGAAFLYTIGRIRIPFLPWPLVYASYTLMAPYQGDVSWNGDWIAEGLTPHGTWISIPLKPYFPAIRGEANVRMSLRSFDLIGDTDLLYAKYRELALLLLKRERAKGHLFEQVHIIYQTWPRSPEGYDALHKEPFLLRHEVVTSVP